MSKGKKVGKYELGRTLGSGSFSKVKLGVDDQGKQYAVKIIDKEQLVREHMEEQLKREISIMRMLNHPHIVKLFDVLQTQNHIYLVLELVTGGELFDRIVAAQRFDEEKGRHFFQQLIVSLHFCHRNGVAHRDLKPENLLVDEKDNIKITDFGLANLNEGTGTQLLNTVCGTPNYVAPEVLQEKGYDGITADVWSCGIILFVMLSGYLPFDDPQLNALFTKIERGEFRMSKHFSDGARDLIGKMLVVDVKKRLTLDGVMKHPWFMKNFDRSVFDSYSGVTIKATDAGGKGDASYGNQAKEQDVAGVPVTQIKTAALGAFEIISQLTLGSISGLASSTPVRPGPRFIVGKNVKDTFDGVVALLVKMNAAPKNKELEIKGFLNKTKGLLTYTITIIPLVVDDMCMVEARRGRGDTLDFHELFRTLVVGLGTAVLSKELAAGVVVVQE